MEQTQPTPIATEPLLVPAPVSGWAQVPPYVPVRPRQKRDCCYCKLPFQPRRDDQKYCGKGCREAAYNESLQVRSQLRERGISPGTVGAIAEMLVCADLLRRGYDVFRAVSPNSPADLVVLYEHKLYSIEVRTGYRKFAGSDGYVVTNPRHFANILAVVIHGDGGTPEIFYTPALPGGEFVDSRSARTSTVEEEFGIQN